MPLRFVALTNYRDYILAMTDCGRLYRIWYDPDADILRQEEEFQIC
jgi:hypothetical protein